MYMANVSPNRKVPNINYIPLVRVGARVRSVGVRVGSVGVRVGSMRDFEYQHVGIGNAKIA